MWTRATCHDFEDFCEKNCEGIGFEDCEGEDGEVSGSGGAQEVVD